MAKIKQDRELLKIIDDYKTFINAEKRINAPIIVSEPKGNHGTSLYTKNRHKAQRKAKFYINKCRSASCMQSGWKRTSA
jgi:hypothetical protein